jgi:hypothetical protein
MSEKVKVDAGMMKEHKAAVSTMLYPRRRCKWNGAVIQDGPPPRRPGGVIVWLLLGAGIGLAAIILLAAGCKTIEVPYFPDIPWPGTAATNDAGTVTTTTTTTTTQPPAASEYRITRVTASDIFWTGPDLTWDERSARSAPTPEDVAMIERAGGPCCGEAHLYRASGKGGKFDHVRRNSKQRDWKNIHGGYGGHVEPDNGEACELWLVSYDGKQRVKVGGFQWVR